MKLSKLSKPILINLVLYIKTSYKKKEIDIRQLSFMFNRKKDLNLIWFSKTKKIAQKHADYLSLIYQLVSITYIITWSNIKKEKKLISSLFKYSTYIIEANITYLIK